MAITSAKVGDTLINNDPRKKGERHAVTTVGATFVKYQSAKRICTVQFHRIFDDNKDRSVGYNIVPGTFEQDGA